MSSINLLRLIFGRKTLLSSGRGQCDSWSVSLFWCFHVSWVVAVFFCTPFVCMVVYESMFSELERLRSWARGPCDNHMIVAWLSRQLICSESVVSRILVEREGEYIVVSQQFAGIKNFVSRFGRKNRRQIHRLHDLNVKIGTDSRGSQGRVYRRCVGTRKVRLVSRGTCEWRERPFDDTGVRPVTRGDRDLVPARPTTRWTWVISFGTTRHTESPDVVTDDRPSRKTIWGVYILLFLFVRSW